MNILNITAQRSSNHPSWYTWDVVVTTDRRAYRLEVLQTKAGVGLFDGSEFMIQHGSVRNFLTERSVRFGKTYETLAAVAVGKVKEEIEDWAGAEEEREQSRRDNAPRTALPVLHPVESEQASDALRDELAAAKAEVLQLEEQNSSLQHGLRGLHVERNELARERDELREALSLVAAAVEGVAKSKARVFFDIKDTAAAK